MLYFKFRFIFIFTDQLKYDSKKCCITRHCFECIIIFYCQFNYCDISIHVSDSNLPQTVDHLHVKVGNTAVQSLKTLIVMCGCMSWYIQ
jgi:hypothetical protein